ncbi:MAG: RidA family protein [Pigmentiphaga sp.]|nr:RidA family protein [Pigmentiphaga sp.]
MSIQRLHGNGRMSEVVIHGDTIYLAGQVADDASAPIAEQTRQVLAHVDRLLGEAGSHRGKILSAQIWLKDMADFAAMNEVWDAWVDRANAPARATGQVALADPNLRIEVIVVAGR